MDAKMRANFINAVAAGEKIPCPKCNTLNDSDSFVCTTCGSPLTKPATQTAEPAPAVPASDEVPFAPATPAPEAAPVAPKAPESASSEEVSVFAKGLPAWDMLPPQVMVRRKRK